MFYLHLPNCISLSLSLRNKVIWSCESELLSLRGLSRELQLSRRLSEMWVYEGIKLNVSVLHGPLPWPTIKVYTFTYSLHLTCTQYLWIGHSTNRMIAHFSWYNQSRGCWQYLIYIILLWPRNLPPCGHKFLLYRELTWPKQESGGLMREPVGQLGSN